MCVLRESVSVYSMCVCVACVCACVCDNMSMCVFVCDDIHLFSIVQ